MSLRIGGFAAILGAALVSLALFLGSGPLVNVDGTVVLLLLLPGLLALLVALGLISFQARIHPLLSWAAFTVLAVGMVASTVGILGLGVLGLRVQDDGGLGGALMRGLVLWVSVFTIIIGSALFGIVTYRTAVLSKWVSLLFAAAAVMLAVGVAQISAEGDLSVGDVALYPAIICLVGIICFVAGWFALGVQAIRRDRVSTSPSARDRKSGAG